MKKTSLLILPLIISVLISCNAYQAINTQDLSINMSKQEVFNRLNTEALQEYIDENIEIYRLRKRIVRGGIAEYQQYFIYFQNGKLIKIDKGEKAVDYRIQID